LYCIKVVNIKNARDNGLTIGRLHLEASSLADTSHTNQRSKRYTLYNVIYNV
jgi:hypothetical protein